MAKVKLFRREVERGLPRVCMCCGEEAVMERRRRFSWYPPWVNFLILVGLLPAAIVATVLSKKMVVHVPFCREHQNHWLSRKLIIWGGLGGLAILGVLALLVVTALESGARNRNDGFIFAFICLGMSLLFIFWLIVVFIVQSGAIKPVEITDRTITLTKVSQGFIDALGQNDDDEYWESRSRRRPTVEDSEECFDPGERNQRPRPRDGFRDNDDRDR